MRPPDPSRPPKPFRHRELEFDGRQYTIHDLSSIDESALDFDFPFDVQNIVTANEVNTRNARIIISFLRDRGLNVEKFLDQRYTRHPFSFLNNPYNWFSFEELMRLHQIAKGEMGTQSPRALFEMGKYSVQFQSTGMGLDTLGLMMPLRKIYWDSPKYNRMFNNIEFMQSRTINGNTYTVIDKFAESMRSRVVLDYVFWTLGIYVGLPKIKGLEFAKGSVDYTFLPIETVLAREYQHLGIRPQIRQERIGRLSRKTVLVEGQQLAREVILLKEDAAARPGTRRRPAVGAAYSPAPHEFEEFGPARLADMLQNRMATQAMLITRTLVCDGELVAVKGELFNAPYTRFTVQFTDTNSLGDFFRSILMVGTRNRILQNAINTEALVAKEEAMRANSQAQQALASEARALHEQTKSEKKSEVFKTYTRKSLVERVEAGEDPRFEPSRSFEMAVLFSDICGFTALSESMSPEDLVKFLNSYFNRINGPIARFNGEIDKLMGDCIMAGFRNERNPDDSARNAVQAAVEIRRSLQHYNRERYEYHQSALRETGRPFFRVENGIGVSFGRVIVGNIGSSDKLDYTVIGDTVNVSARLESLTRYYGVGILISEEIHERLNNIFTTRFVDNVLVKGKQSPVRIYEVFDHEPESIKDKKAAVGTLTQDAFSCYETGRFKEAQQIYSEARQRVGPHTYNSAFSADPLLDFYHKRCEEVARHMETGLLDPDTWRGIYVFKEK